MSLCRNRNLDFEDNINDNQYPRKNIEDIRTNPMDLSKGSIRRTKKIKHVCQKNSYLTRKMKKY